MSETSNDDEPQAEGKARFTGSEEFYHENGEPHLNLMAYCGQAKLLLECFAAGYEVHDGLLHDACCGRPTFRGYSHDDHYPHWPEAFHETVRVLIAEGADVNAKGPSGDQKYEGCEPWVSNAETPLHYAAGAWDLNILQQLLDAGADPGAKNDHGETPADWAVRYSAPEEVVKLLAAAEGEEKPGA